MNARFFLEPFLELAICTVSPLSPLVLATHQCECKCKDRLSYVGTVLFLCTGVVDTVLYSCFRLPLFFSNPTRLFPSAVLLWSSHGWPAPPQVDCCPSYAWSKEPRYSARSVLYQLEVRRRGLNVVSMYYPSVTLTRSFLFLGLGTFA